MLACHSYYFNLLILNHIDDFIKVFLKWVLPYQTNFKTSSSRAAVRQDILWYQIWKINEVFKIFFIFAVSKVEKHQSSDYRIDNNIYIQLIPLNIDISVN